VLNISYVAPGDYTISCTVNSLFWSKGYGLPNSDPIESATELLSTPYTEAYTATATVRVLPATVAIPWLM
jgi:hypothetical protein